MATRYFIEQAQDRFYDESNLAAAKSRARSLSKKSDGGVYLIAEAFNDDLSDYEQVGSIAYYGGTQDALEGIFGRLAEPAGVPA